MKRFVLCAVLVAVVGCKKDAAKQTPSAEATKSGVGSVRSAGNGEPGVELRFKQGMAEEPCT